MESSDDGMAKPVRLTTAHIVDAAAVLADTEGFDAVNLSRIARDLGVRQPALYRHIDGVDALNKSLVLRARELLIGRLTEAAIGQSGEVAIRATANAWRAFVTDHPGLYTATDRVTSHGDPELEASVDRVVHVLALVLSGFSLGPTAAVHAARSLRSALHGFAVLEKDGGHPGSVDLDDSFEQLVTLLVAGIQAMPADQADVPSRRARARTSGTTRVEAG